CANSPLGSKLPHQLAVAAIHYVEVPVARPKVYPLPLEHRRSGKILPTYSLTTQLGLHRKTPNLRARVGIYAISKAITTGDNDQLICDSRRAHQGTASAELPAHLAVGCIKCVKMAISTANINRLLMDRGAATNRPLGFKAPLNFRRGNIGLRQAEPTHTQTQGQ